VLALLMIAPSVVTSQQVVRLSGRVERIDLDEGRVVVDVMGRRGRREVHEVYVVSETPIVVSARLRPWEMRDGQAFGETPVSLADVVTGDFVVVESTLEGGRAIALRITVVESRPHPRPGS